MCGDCSPDSRECAIHYNSYSYDNVYFRPVIREEATQNEVMGDDTDELRISRMEDEILEEGGGADSDEGGDDGGTFLDFTSTTKHGKQVWLHSSLQLLQETRTKHTLYTASISCHSP